MKKWFESDLAAKVDALKVQDVLDLFGGAIVSGTATAPDPTCFARKRVAYLHLEASPAGKKQ